MKRTMKGALQTLLERHAHPNLAGKVEKNSVEKCHGGYSDIYIGVYTRPGGTQCRVAVKKFRVHIMDDRKLQKTISKELGIWSRLNHPRILALEGFYIEDGRFPHLVSRWMENGTAIKYLEETPDADVLSLIIGIAEGIRYLHSEAIVHSDIKPDNVLISDEGEPLLCDFGISRMLAASHTFSLSTALTTGARGTIRYMSKEILGGTDEEVSAYSTESDVWAFGMTTFTLLTQKVPYYNIKSDVPVILAIVGGFLPTWPTTSEPDLASQQCMRDICAGCWLEESDRWPIDVVLAKLHHLQRILSNSTNTPDTKSSALIESPSSYNRRSDGSRRRNSLPVLPRWDKTNLPVLIIPAEHVDRSPRSLKELPEYVAGNDTQRHLQEDTLRFTTDSVDGKPASSNTRVLSSISAPPASSYTPGYVSSPHREFVPTPFHRAQTQSQDFHYLEPRRTNTSRSISPRRDYRRAQTSPRVDPPQLVKKQRSYDELNPRGSVHLTQVGPNASTAELSHYPCEQRQLHQNPDIAGSERDKGRTVMKVVKLFEGHVGASLATPGADDSFRTVSSITRPPALIDSTSPLVRDACDRRSDQERYTRSVKEIVRNFEDRRTEGNDDGLRAVTPVPTAFSRTYSPSSKELMRSSILQQGTSSDFVIRKMPRALVNNGRQDRKELSHSTSKRPQNLPSMRGSERSSNLANAQVRQYTPKTGTRLRAASDPEPVAALSRSLEHMPSSSRRTALQTSGSRQDLPQDTTTDSHMLKLRKQEKKVRGKAWFDTALLPVENPSQS